MANNNLQKIDTISFPNSYGIFNLTTFETCYPNQPGMKFAMLLEKNSKLPSIPYVRIHSQCLLGDTFSTLLCDCKQQLETSFRIISEKGGILIYLDQEARGHSLSNKIRELKLQEKDNLDTTEASEALGLEIDSRSYVVAYDILAYYNIKEINLLTNNPDKISTLVERGIKVNRISIDIDPNPYNAKYLKTKKNKLNHLLREYP